GPLFPCARAAMSALVSNRTRVFFLRDSDVAEHMPALAREGFECRGLDNVREAPLGGDTRHIAATGGLGPGTKPALLVLDTAAFAAAWDNDQFRLKYLARTYIGVIVVHPPNGRPLPERMAESVLDELFRP